MDEISHILEDGTLNNATSAFFLWENVSTPIDLMNGTTAGNVTSPGAYVNTQNLFMSFYHGLLALWSIMALVGNALTIFVVVNFEALQTNNNILICSLAAADIVGGLVGPFIILHQMNLDSLFYVPLCLLEKVSTRNKDITCLIHYKTFTKLTLLSAYTLHNIPILPSKRPFVTCRIQFTNIKVYTLQNFHKTDFALCLYIT